MNGRRDDDDYFGKTESGYEIAGLTDYYNNNRVSQKYPRFPYRDHCQFYTTIRLTLAV